MGSLRRQLPVGVVLRHDIRNSLGVVRGHTEMVADGADDEDLVDSASTIREQTDDPRVTVAVQPRENTVRLEVRDNGPGVPEDVLADAEGGLDLVQTLVEHYGGDLRVSSNESCGTAFFVDLPRASGD